MTAMSARRLQALHTVFSNRTFASDHNRQTRAIQNHSLKAAKIKIQDKTNLGEFTLSTTMPLLRHFLRRLFSCSRDLP